MGRSPVHDEQEGAEHVLHLLVQDARVVDQIQRHVRRLPVGEGHGTARPQSAAHAGGFNSAGAGLAPRAKQCQ